MGTRIWHECAGEVDATGRSRLLAALSAAGLQIDTPQAAPPRAAGLVVAARLDDGLETLLRARRDGAGRILVVALGIAPTSTEHAWRIIEAGAADILAWDERDGTASDIAARFERWQTIEDIVASPQVTRHIVGRSPALRHILREAVEVARFTDASVLITGESGTGKELLARLIHELDPRQTKQDFVILDCSTIVPELSGSEFFGHERGAYTGAVSARDGAFELADKGTLFLDEIGELAPALQAELLRVIQERSYKRVGSNTWRTVEFRLVCATNRDLEEERDRGRFRNDLYHRVAAWTCRLPPLRDRIEDILPLVEHFLGQALQAEPPPLDPAVSEFFVTRPYAGNLRELRHLVHRIGQRHVGGGPITLGDIPESEVRARRAGAVDWRTGPLDTAVRMALAAGVGLRELGQAATDAAVRVALADAAGNVQGAAQRLGVTARALQLRLAKERGGAADDVPV